MESSHRFSGIHVAVTGAGRGIGRAIARAFADEGARVSIYSRTEQELRALAQAAAAGSIFPQVCDVTDRDSVAGAVGRAVGRLGPVEALVNNAGIFLWKPFLELSPSQWDGVLATNLTGAYNFCRETIPGMRKRRSGRIVNVSSIHGLHGEANLSAHCAAKFGLIGLTQSLAKELRADNVTVNAVCPGTTENRSPGEVPPGGGSPLSEKLQPGEVAAVVLWLCSADAAGITGASIEVYGRTQVRIQP
jgi:NAD(P)-dependent dehydrogenase (short-subunit alcohol dehydrogenase family)